MIRRILIIGLLFLWGCGTGSPFDRSQSRAESASHPPVDARLSEAFMLRIGQEARIRSESLTLLFRSVPEDSRCPEEPEEVDCVWEGNAQVRIELVKQFHARRTLDFNTTLEPRRGPYLEYEVQLLSLEPPRTASVPPDRERYVAQLMVIKP